MQRKKNISNLESSVRSVKPQTPIPLRHRGSHPQPPQDQCSSNTVVFHHPHKSFQECRKSLQHCHEPQRLLPHRREPLGLHCHSSSLLQQALSTPPHATITKPTSPPSVTFNPQLPLDIASTMSHDLAPTVYRDPKIC